MRKLGIAPKILDFVKQSPILNDWFETATGRFNMYSGTADPTLAEVPKDQWIVYKNTTANEVRIWVNDGGTLKKTAAFT